MLQQGMVAFVCKLSKTVLLLSVNLLPKIINLFILFDVVPTKAKVARIIPAHKSGDCNLPIFPRYSKKLFTLKLSLSTDMIGVFFISRTVWFSEKY